MNLPHVTEAEHHHEGFTLFFVTFVLILFNTLPHTLFGWWTPLSFLPMIPLYFLSLKKTLLFSAPAAFIAGLLQDSLTGVPFGIWPLSFLIVCLSARLSAPLFATSKLIIFAGWVIAVFFAGFTVYMAASFAYGVWTGFDFLLWELLFSILAYPLFFLLRHVFFSFFTKRKMS